MNRTIFAFAFFCLTAPALAQGQATPPVGPDWSKVSVTTTDLGHATYMMSNGISGNVTVAVGKDGIVMIDGQHAPMHDKLKAAVAAVSDKPVKFLVNTHHHGDHSGGNAGFAADGVTVVANETEAGYLRDGTTTNTTGIKVPPVEAAAVPKKTYREHLTLKVGGRTAKLTHVAAHTGGDTYAWFADANVLSTGDNFTNGRYPNIDWVNGGKIDGVLKVTGAYLKLINDQTKIVPGHGPLATKAQLADYRAMIMTARERMKTLIAQGKSEQEIYDAKPFADLDAKWAPNEQAAKTFVRVVYNNVKK